MSTQFRQWFDRYIRHPKHRYRLVYSFEDISKPINCMVFLNEDLLASAGDDQAVSIWDLKNGCLWQRVEDHTERWGQITCMALASTARYPTLLVCGTGRSQVVTLSRSEGTSQRKFQEMECLRVFEGGNFTEALAFDSPQRRLAVTSHYGHVKVFHMDETGLLTQLWSQELGSIIPRAIHFVERGEKLVVYSLRDGNYWVLDVDTAEIREAHTLQTNVGNLDYHPPKKLLLIDNMSAGFDLFPARRSAASQKYLVRRNEGCIIMAKFAEEAKRIITGSDHGLVYIFDTRTAEMLQTCHHGGSSALIQTVATATLLSGDHIIASASAEERSSIYIWRKPKPITVSTAGTTQRGEGYPSDISRNICWVLVGVLICAIVQTGYQTSSGIMLGGWGYSPRTQGLEPHVDEDRATASLTFEFSGQLQGSGSAPDTHHNAIEVELINPKSHKKENGVISLQNQT